jgi:hypothetical protein
VPGGLTRTCCNAANPITDSYGAGPGSNGLVTVLVAVPVLKNLFIPASPCGVLPVVITDFRAAAIAAEAVALSWTVEQFLNFSKFEVEYSTDGVHFNAAGTVLFTADKNNYQFIQQAVASPVNYYRLKLVDGDGRFSYSPVLTVRLSGNTGGTVALYPNPAAKNLTIRIKTGSAQTGTIAVLDNSGKRITEKRVNLISGQNFISFPEIDQLPAGLYHVYIETGGRRYTEKLLKY